MTVHWSETSIDNPWDILVLDDVRIAGIAKVKITLGVEIDLGKPSGESLGAVTIKGLKHADVVVDLLINTPEELDAFTAQASRLLPRPKGGTAKAITISHPMTDIWNLRVLTLEQIQCTPPNGGESMMVTLGFKQWADTAGKVKQPKVAQSDGLDVF